MHSEISRKRTFQCKQTTPPNQLSVSTLAQNGFYHGEGLEYMDMYYVSIVNQMLQFEICCIMSISQTKKKQ